MALLLPVVTVTALIGLAHAESEKKVKLLPVSVSAGAASVAAANRTGIKGQRVSLASSAKTAGLANTATATNVKPQIPKIATLSASGSGVVSA